MIGRAVLGIAPVLMLTSQPSFAASDMRDTVNMERHRAAFAGLHLRMNMGGRMINRPTARLKLGLVSFRHDGRLASQTHHDSALEFGFSRSGRADIYVGGQRLTDFRHRLGIADAEAGLLVLVGLAAGALAISKLSDSDPDLDPHSPCPPGVEICAN